jgi:lipopolysaccharide biosynthesis glycosyltransferase
MVMVYSAAVNSDAKNFKIIVGNMNGMLSHESIDIAERFIKSLGLDLEILNITTSLNPNFDHQFNLTVYARLFLMDMLEENFIWFDADLLLMPGWDEIFIESFDRANENIVVYGVLDSKLTRERLKKNLNQAYLRSEGVYVNAGMLKILTKNWRKLQKDFDWQDMAINMENFGLSLNDQDIINYICAGFIKLMPAGFNYIVGDDISFQEKIRIKHFAGSPKPWQLDKEGKEFLLAVQGAKYFSPQDWVTQSADAFLDYPKYWQIEGELMKYLQDVDDGLGQQVAGLRGTTVKKLDRVALFKHHLIQFISKRFYS